VVRAQIHQLGAVARPPGGIRALAEGQDADACAAQATRDRQGGLVAAQQDRRRKSRHSGWPFTTTPLSARIASTHAFEKLPAATESLYADSAASFSSSRRSRSSANSRGTTT